MSFLVDTNGWIGFLAGQADFGPRAKAVMIERSEECHVSIASIWEAAIKVGIGKLKLPYDLETDLPRLLTENGFNLIPLEYEEAAAVRDLERIHGDPFDRIQVVQARRRGWKIISRDPIFDRYGINRVW